MRLIEHWRRNHKWSARRIRRYLVDHAVAISLRTVGRWLHRLEISRLRDLTPEGENLCRTPGRIRATWPGHMIHLEVKKVGRIPDGGGSRAHGRGSTSAKAAKRGLGAKVGYICLHSAVVDTSRLAYTEAREDEKTVKTIGFVCRARAFCSSRHHPATPGRDRKRCQLQGPTLHPLRTRPDRPAPAHPPLHATAQREGSGSTGRWPTRCSSPAPPPVNRSAGPRSACE